MTNDGSMILEHRGIVADPAIRRIGLADVFEALRRGLDDFRDNPTHLIFLGLVYPIVGIAVGRIAAGYDALPLVWPLFAGFALVGPFVAVGLYELSRRRERGLPVSTRNAFDIFHTPRIAAIGVLGFVYTFFFVLWLGIAQRLYDRIMGTDEITSIGSFLHDVFMTGPGWALIVLGTDIGFVFALLALTFGVVSFPILVDRDRDLGPSTDVQMGIALRTSARAVLANPLALAVWGLVVVSGLVLGTVTLLVGLAVVVPVLGHATWHLYRRLVD
jgi:uncharacterized membrane protein